MACALGIEQGCGECRMCENGKGGKNMYDGWHYCDNCFYNGKCEKQKETFGIKACKDGNPNKKFTNADKIRNMTNEELAEFLLKVNTAYSEPCMTGEADCKWEDYPTYDKGCKDCFKEWLESECDVECLDQK